MKHAAIAACLALSACTGMIPSGEPLQGEAPANLITHRMLIPTWAAFFADAGSATIIAPGWAATPQHAYFPWASDGWPVYSKPPMDLVFFPVEEGEPLPIGTPQEGEQVTLYGAAFSGAREAHGVVQFALVGNCKGDAGQGDDGGPIATYCRKQGKGMVKGAFIESDAGPGFSGGYAKNSAGEWIALIADWQKFWKDGKLYDGVFAYWAGDVLKAMKEAMR